jgi:hypothetical protein
MVENAPTSEIGAVGAIVAQALDWEAPCEYTANNSAAMTSVLLIMITLRPVWSV